MTKTVAAYEARTRLGELLNLVYYKGDTVVIEKMGKPMVKLISVKEEKDKTNKKRNPLKWAGIWKGREGDLIVKEARRLRESMKLLPHKHAISP